MTETEFASWAYNAPEVEKKQKPLRTMTGKNIDIWKAYKDNNELYGDCVVLVTEQGEYYSFSKLIAKQYVAVQNMLLRAKILRAGVTINEKSQNLLTAPFPVQSTLTEDEKQEEKKA